MIERTPLRPLIVAYAMSAFLAATPALAQDNDWLRWGAGNATGTINTGVDREFIKAWEKNPPKGFPTLSQANLAPMKAAIKLYEDIVKRGGWQPLPDVKQLEGKSLQLGQTAPGVALVAARLAMTGDLEGGSGSAGYFDAALEKAVKGSRPPTG